MWIAAVFGWLFGRNIRASRQAARNAALPEAEKQRLWDETHDPHTRRGAKNWRKASRHGEFIDGKFVPH